MTSNTAKLNGSVNAQGLATTYYFAYGINNYDQQTPFRDAGASSNPLPVSEAVVDLQPNSLYHVRLIAGSQGGVAAGNDVTFTTPATPTPTPAPTPTPTPTSTPIPTSTPTPTPAGDTYCHSRLGRQCLHASPGRHG